MTYDTADNRLIFLGIAILTAVFGFGLLETTFQGPARILFYVFLIMLLSTLVVAAHAALWLRSDAHALRKVSALHTAQGGPHA